MTAAAQFPGSNAPAPGGAPQGQRMTGQQVLGMVGAMIDRGRYREAASQTQQLIKQAPDSLPVLILHGSAMRRIGRPIAARNALEQALAILELTPPAEPGEGASEEDRLRWKLATVQPRMRAELAWVRIAEDDAAGALDVLGPGLEVQPDELYMLSVHAAALVEAGKNDEARAAIEKLLQTGEPGAGRTEALVQLADVLVGQLDHPAVDLDAYREVIAASIDRGGLSAERLSDALRRQGDLHAHAGAHDEAFMCWRRAVNLRRSEMDPARMAQAFSTAASAWTADTMRKLRVTPVSEAAPVLVLGPPGTGAARLTGLLATHDRVHDAGASEALQQLAGRRFAKDGRPSVEALTRPASLRGKDIAEVGKLYADRIRDRAGGGEGVVLDRNPHNILLVGLVALALPNAKIIFVEHAGEAASLDSYAHDDLAEHPYADDLRALGLVRLSHEHLRDHWQRTLDELSPGRWTSVSVESMLADPAGERERVSEFLGLDSPGAIDGGVPAWRRMSALPDPAHYADHTRELRDVLAAQAG